MYQIAERPLKTILQRKFSSLVGVVCENIDKFQKKYKLDEKECHYTKELLKKLHYEAMREVENQIRAFSEGVTIGVTLIKPTSKKEE